MRKIADFHGVRLKYAKRLIDSARHGLVELLKSIAAYSSYCLDAPRRH